MKQTSFSQEGFEPIYNSESKILILGSYPSVISRQQGFYYGNKHNRFWKVMSILFNENLEDKNIDYKKDFLRKNGIALHDVISSCEICGSSDMSIKNVTPSDIPSIINKTKVKKIFLNGKTAYNLFVKYFPQYTDIIVSMPSTSPANAVKKLDNLVSDYKIIIDYLK